MKKTKAKFTEAKCDRSPMCPVARVCPSGAVTKMKQGFLKIQVAYDEAKCTGCGNCVKYCPHGAFAMK